MRIKKVFKGKMREDRQKTATVLGKGFGKPKEAAEELERYTGEVKKEFRAREKGLHRLMEEIKGKRSFERLEHINTEELKKARDVVAEIAERKKGFQLGGEFGDYAHRVKILRAVGSVRTNAFLDRLARGDPVSWREIEAFRADISSIIRRRMRKR